jgi:hypothetical protein
MNPGMEGRMSAMEKLAPTSRRKAARSLGSQLEHDRLTRRAVRVRQVIAALRERAAAREGETPQPLRIAIEDFGRELATLERQLRHAGGR